MLIKLHLGAVLNLHLIAINSRFNFKLRHRQWLVRESFLRAKGLEWVKRGQDQESQQSVSLPGLILSHIMLNTHTRHTHTHLSSVYQRKLTKALFFVCGMKENKKRESRDDCGNVLLTITSIAASARPWIFILCTILLFRGRTFSSFRRRRLGSMSRICQLGFI